MTSKAFIPAAVAAVLLVTSVDPPAFGRKTVKTSAFKQLPKDEKVLHALNRLAFGPTPGQVEGVEKSGLDRWIDEQLHPERITENRALSSKLEPLETLRLSPEEMAVKYPPNFVLKAMVDGRAPWPKDPQQRVIVQKLADRNLKGKSGDAASFDEVLKSLPTAQRGVFESGTPAQQLRLLETLEVGTQFDVLSAMPEPQRRKLFVAANPETRRRLMQLAAPMQLVSQDLATAKILRAVYSKRQLAEVLTDFWYNHFNVYFDKGIDRYLVTSYEQQAIRPHVLGKFEDLLLATAKSPAMLFYLDNFQSAAPDLAQRAPNARTKGLNENYGRELLELHTLGVDGGYTQKDVTEVARCFTGWSIRDPRRSAEFQFRERLHDRGEKHVLGHTIRAGGGIEDGYEVIRILSHHPSTAQFISRKIGHSVRIRSASAVAVGSHGENLPKDGWRYP